MAGSTPIEEFWQDWHRTFDTPDGSLPEVRLTGVHGPHLDQLWRTLTSQALTVLPSTLWRTDLSREVPLSDVPDAAALVATGSVPFFHAVVRGVTVRGVRLPDLGIFCAPGELALDYQPGAEWDLATFHSLLALLCHLHHVAPESTVTAEEGVADSYRLAFESAFAALCDKNAA